MPTALRKLIVTGSTADGSHSLIATMYEPAEHIDKVQAYLLSNGYKVDNPEPETDATPETGHPGDVELHSHYQAHADYLEAIGVTDLAAHVESLKGNN